MNFIKNINENCVLPRLIYDYELAPINLIENHDKINFRKGDQFYFLNLEM